MKLSIVSPVYRAEFVLNELVERIANSIPFDFTSYEIILVDDFSPDESWREIVKISNKNPNVRGFKLSRNFGQHYAITAGLSQVSGDYVVVLDCDLQDQPEEIEKLYLELKKGFDIVLARRYERKDSFYKKTVSKLFYKALSYLTGTKHDATVANFGIYSKQVIKEVVKLEEKIKYFPTMVRWVGFSTSYVDVEHASRAEGKSNYNLKKLLNFYLFFKISFEVYMLFLYVFISVSSIISWCEYSYSVIKLFQ